MMVSDACPLSCNSCRSKAVTVNPSAIPTSSPTQSPTFEDEGIPVCRDNTEYLLNGLKSCRYIFNKSQERHTALCENTEVLINCPVTCGVCCADDPTFEYSVESSLRSCSSVSTNPTDCDLYVNRTRVKFGCPLSCGTCHARRPDDIINQFNAVAKKMGQN